MLNFPVPYPEEMIYSTVARAGVHNGLISPKQLLDEVFANRKVIATPDLPCYLGKISDLFPRSLKLDVTSITYRHTLFPLYTPFIPEKRRIKCLKWMAGRSNGSVHLSLGVAASRVKQIRFLRYCPACCEQQLIQYGEYYWMRAWQVAGADVCLFHHTKLVDSQIELHSRHRHNFSPLSNNVSDKVLSAPGTAGEVRLAQRINELLTLPQLKSPSLEQWGVYYKLLARDAGCTKGKKVLHDKISEKIISRFTPEWLEKHGLFPTDSNSCWLKSIFRRHRKSFSYLEHIVTLDALLGSEWNFKSVVKDVLNSKPKSATSCPVHFPRPLPSQKTLTMRRSWEALLKEFGVKKARLSGGAAVYIWLYRNDRTWLMKINGIYRRSSRSKNTRVDWKNRDKNIVDKLLVIYKKSLNDLECPRRSRNWYLNQLGCKTTIQSNFNKLPLTVRFFDKHCETVPCYQIRRIADAVRKLNFTNDSLQRWKILRLAGLSDDRICSEADHYLKQAK